MKGLEAGDLILLAHGSQRHFDREGRSDAVDDAFFGKKVEPSVVGHVLGAVNEAHQREATEMVRAEAWGVALVLGAGVWGVPIRKAEA